MAKKTSKRQQASAPIQDALVDWAEDLGRLLGTAETKAKGWIDQRKAVATQLEGIRDTASRLLEQLTGSQAAEVASLALIPRKGVADGKRKGAAAVVTNAHYPGVSKRKGGMTAEGRARVAEAQRARWAKIRAEKERAARKGAKKKAAP